MKFVYGTLATLALFMGGIWLYSDEMSRQCGSEIAAKRFAKQAIDNGLDLENVNAHPDGDCVYMVTGTVGGSPFSTMVAFDKATDEYRVYDTLITN